MKLKNKRIKKGGRKRLIIHKNNETLLKKNPNCFSALVNNRIGVFIFNF